MVFYARMSNREYCRIFRQWITGTGLQAEDYVICALRRVKAPVIWRPHDLSSALYVFR